MSIIVITIPDVRKQRFVAELQRQTGGAVSLVIVQDRPPVTWRMRWQQWRTRPLLQTLREMYYAVLLRGHRQARQYLQVFHTTPNGIDTQEREIGWAAPVLHVTSVNAPDVRDAITQSQPAVVAVWGAGMLHEATLAAAPIALNVHLGISTKYRGAYANQRAVELGDWDNIGATIHHISKQADAGAVIETIQATLYDTPAETFSTLYAETETAFISTLQNILEGVTLPTTQPDLSASENLRLADWTPERRWRVAGQLAKWPSPKEATSRLQREPSSTPAPVAR